MSVLLVVDGLNVLHRGNFATPPMSNSSGVPTNAIRGFISILLSDMAFVKATHCAVVFDRPGENFRHRLYPEYKATRDKSTDESQDIRSQILPTKELLNLMGIRVFGKRGVEGDDLIGSIAYKLRNKTRTTYIASNDKDFASLVDHKLHLLRPKRLILDEEGVAGCYGVYPEQMLEYLMLIGDKVDNIPGVNKVGAKTAAKWLSQHGTLRDVLRNEKFTKKMQANVDAAKPFFSLSRKLVTVNTSFLPNLTLADVELAGLQPGLASRCKELDFKSTYTHIQNVLG